MTEVQTSEAFAHNWSAEVLRSAPLIAPARQFTYPLSIAGEEDALARGAMYVTVRPGQGRPGYLLTCALGFADPALPSGVFACPHPDELCAVAGGYAYLANTATPERCIQIALKPVVALRASVECGLLLFVGFHTVLAWGREGWAWETARLSWEGVTITSVQGYTIHGQGWDLMTDQEMPFEIDLRTGTHRGGAFKR